MSAFVMGAWAETGLRPAWKKSRGIQRALADLLAQAGARRLLDGGERLITIYDVCDICGRQIEGDHKRVVLTSRELGTTRCLCEACAAKLDTSPADQVGKICRVEK